MGTRKAINKLKMGTRKAPGKKDKTGKKRKQCLSRRKKRGGGGWLPTMPSMPSMPMFKKTPAPAPAPVYSKSAVDVGAVFQQELAGKTPTEIKTMLEELLVSLHKNFTECSTECTNLMCSCDDGNCEGVCQQITQFIERETSSVSANMCNNSQKKKDLTGGIPTCQQTLQDQGKVDVYARQLKKILDQSEFDELVARYPKYLQHIKKEK